MCMMLEQGWEIGRMIPKLAALIHMYVSVMCTMYKVHSTIKHSSTLTVYLYANNFHVFMAISQPLVFVVSDAILLLLFCSVVYILPHQISVRPVLRQYLDAPVSSALGVFTFLQCLNLQLM